MPENIEIQDVPVYHTLDEIRLRKAQLLTDITKDSNQVQKLWNNLFHKTGSSAGKGKASSRLSTVVSTGASVLDAFILGWKLYRKFKLKR